MRYILVHEMMENMNAHLEDQSWTAGCVTRLMSEDGQPGVGQQAGSWWGKDPGWSLGSARYFCAHESG